MTENEPVAEADLIRLHAGALTGAERADIARRAEADPAAKALLDAWRAQDEALRTTYGPIELEPLPHAMRALLDAARAEDWAEARQRLTWPLRIAAAAGLLAIGAAGGFQLARMEPADAPSGRFAEAALVAHATYVTEIAHPVEVEAARADHLTRWLSKRLGHPVRAPDFAAAGFRLVGGRLLPSEPGPAALFMYEDDPGRRVTLYVVPGAGGGDTAFRFAERGDSQSFYWIDGDLAYAVTGAIPRDALLAIAVAAHDQLG